MKLSIGKPVLFWYRQDQTDGTWFVRRIINGDEATMDGQTLSEYDKFEDRVAFTYDEFVDLVEEARLDVLNDGTLDEFIKSKWEK